MLKGAGKARKRSSENNGYTHGHGGVNGWRNGGFGGGELPIYPGSAVKVKVRSAFALPRAQRHDVDIADLSKRMVSLTLTITTRTSHRGGIHTERLRIRPHACC
jgi:hypothetical protein